MDITAYALSKKYTEDTADSLGSLKGAPCTVKSIEDIAGGHRVTFEWTGTSGQKQTSAMDVMDGLQGQDGAPGQDGAKGDDGFSPTVTIENITGGHRVIITDATGDHPFDVMDGDGGQAESVDWSKITNKPTDLVQDAEYVHTDNNYTDADKASVKTVGFSAFITGGPDYRGRSDTYTARWEGESSFEALCEVIETVPHGEVPPQIVIDVTAPVDAYYDFYDDECNKMFTVTSWGSYESMPSDGWPIIAVNVSGIETAANRDANLLIMFCHPDNTITIKRKAIGGGGGGSDLTADLTTTKAVGGIPVGKEYREGDSLETIFRDMLNPVENPVLTDPSATIATSGATLLEAGTTVNKTFTITFNRGSINPKYGTSGYRAGVATGYSLNGGESQSGNTFNVEVTESNKTFSGSVSYAQGEQPKNSAGENYSTPLPAGSVNTSNTVTFEFVDALWSNAANIAVVAKEALVSKSTKLKQFNFPAQTAANPEVFDVPASWTVTAVELLNPLSGQWVSCVSEFDVSDVTHGTVAYKRYTYNGGGATGARSVRIKWS